MDLDDETLSALGYGNGHDATVEWLEERRRRQQGRLGWSRRKPGRAKRVPLKNVDWKKLSKKVVDDFLVKHWRGWKK